MAEPTHFTSSSFAFLRDLARNNDREWFQKNKSRYEKELKEPALRFIADFAPHLAKISSHFRADPRPVGGSMFRIYRDTRFSKDKSPYKTHTGLHFRHDRAKDAHAPGFYLHIQPGEVFMGVGIWHPDSGTLGKIREAIVEKPDAWKRTVGGKRFRERFELEGDSLKRPPRGIDPEHPCIEDLKRKDFIGVTRLTEKDVVSPGFLKQFATLCRDGSGLVRYLCEAVEVPF